MAPIQHDTPAEIAQATNVRDWKKGEVEPIPGKTMPSVAVVERDYPNLYKRFTAPLWSLLMLELWYRTFVDNSGSSAPEPAVAELAGVS